MEKLPLRQLLSIYLGMSATSLVGKLAPQPGASAKLSEFDLDGLSPDQEECIYNVLTGDEDFTTVVGLAGTGKSYVLKLLRRMFKELFITDVVTVAPTGRAAANINGKTYHRTFGVGSSYPLPQNCSYQIGYKGRKRVNDLANKARVPRQNRDLVILLDEGSMISSQTLVCLTQIARMVRPGGIIRWVLFMGPEQLPPIKKKDAPYNLVDLAQDPARFVMGENGKDYNVEVVPSPMFGNPFKYGEWKTAVHSLWVNHRQRDEAALANELRAVGFGHEISSDSLLTSRMFTSLPTGVDFENSVHLFYSRAKAHALNMKYYHQSRHEDRRTYHAYVNIKGVRGQVTKFEEVNKGSYGKKGYEVVVRDKDGELHTVYDWDASWLAAQDVPPILYLCKGMPFIVRYNDSKLNVWNGTLGKIVDFKEDSIIFQPKGEERLVELKNDYESQDIPEDEKGNPRYGYSSLPGHAGLGITVNQAQGSTFDCQTVLYIHKEQARFVSEGWAIVGLSRCVRPDLLYIVGEHCNSREEVRALMNSLIRVQQSSVDFLTTALQEAGQVMPTKADYENNKMFYQQACRDGEVLQVQLWYCLLDEYQSPMDWFVTVSLDASNIYKIEVDVKGEKEEIPNDLSNPFVELIHQTLEANKDKYVDLLPIIEEEKPKVGIKIISGGQTGVDRTALEVAQKLGYETGGTAAPRYVTEVGVDDDLALFGLVQGEIVGNMRESYEARTDKNVADADVTILIGKLDSPGSKCALRSAEKHQKPIRTVPLYNLNDREVLATLVNSLRELNPSIINFAGNRASSLGDNLPRVKEVIEYILTELKSPPTPITQMEFKNNALHFFGLTKEVVFTNPTPQKLKGYFGVKVSEDLTLLVSETDDQGNSCIDEGVRILYSEDGAYVVEINEVESALQTLASEAWAEFTRDIMAEDHIYVVMSPELKSEEVASNPPSEPKPPQEDIPNVDINIVEALVQPTVVSIDEANRLYDQIKVLTNLGRTSSDIRLHFEEGGATPEQLEAFKAFYPEVLEQSPTIRLPRQITGNETIPKLLKEIEEYTSVCQKLEEDLKTEKQEVASLSKKVENLSYTLREHNAQRQKTEDALKHQRDGANESAKVAEAKALEAEERANNAEAKASEAEDKLLDAVQKAKALEEKYKVLKAQLGVHIKERSELLQVNQYLSSTNQSLVKENNALKDKVKELEEQSSYAESFPTEVEPASSLSKTDIINSLLGNTDFIKAIANQISESIKTSVEATDNELVEARKRISAQTIRQAPPKDEGAVIVPASLAVEGNQLTTHPQINGLLSQKDKETLKSQVFEKIEQQYKKPPTLIEGKLNLPYFVSVGCEVGAYQITDDPTVREVNPNVFKRSLELLVFLGEHNPHLNYRVVIPADINLLQYAEVLCKLPSNVFLHRYL